jgi:hypothetical protein
MTPEEIEALASGPAGKVMVAMQIDAEGYADSTTEDGRFRAIIAPDGTAHLYNLGAHPYHAQFAADTPLIIVVRTLAAMMEEDAKRS